MSWDRIWVWCWDYFLKPVLIENSVTGVWPHTSWSPLMEISKGYLLFWSEIIHPTGEEVLKMFVCVNCLCHVLLFYSISLLHHVFSLFESQRRIDIIKYERFLFEITYFFRYRSHSGLFQTTAILYQDPFFTVFISCSRCIFFSENQKWTSTQGNIWITDLQIKLEPVYFFLQ